MAKFKLDKTDFQNIVEGDKTIVILKKVSFNALNKEILGLRSIEKKSTQINALSVMFDLEGSKDSANKLIIILQYQNSYLNSLVEFYQRFKIKHFKKNLEWL